MEYVIMFAVIGALAGVVVVLAKKSNEKLKEMISNLSDEQKNKLALTEVNFVEGKDNEWIQEGMIAQMDEKGNKVAMKILWHNKVIQNNFYDQIEYGDTSLSKEEVEKHNLKVGDFVKVKIAPEKSIGSFVIIFD